MINVIKNKIEELIEKDKKKKLKEATRLVIWNWLFSDEEDLEMFMSDTLFPEV